MQMEGTHFPICQQPCFMRTFLWKVSIPEVDRWTPGLGLRAEAASRIQIN
jgi:hypothetical protein